MGIYKENTRKYMVGHQMRQVISNNGVLELDQFYLDATAMGATQDKTLFESELNALPSLVKNEAETVLVPGIYKDGKIYGFNGATKGLVEFNFSREGSGTYFDKNGVLQTAAAGVPRIDFDPVTKYCKGYLIEGATTNYLEYSNNLTHEYWNKVRADSESATVSGMLCNKITCNDNSGYFSVSRWPSMPENRTVSAWVKKGNIRYVQLATRSIVDNIYCTIDLDTGIIIGTSSTLLNPTVTPLPNGWFRVTLSSASGGNNKGISLLSAGADGKTAAYPIGSFFYAANLQIEDGENATSYIPTNGAAGIRAGDSCSAATPLMYVSEGTVYYEANAFPVVTGGTPDIIYHNQYLAFLRINGSGNVGGFWNRAGVLNTPYGTMRKYAFAYDSDLLFNITSGTDNARNIGVSRYPDGININIGSPQAKKVELKSLAILGRNTTLEERTLVTT